MHLSEPCFSLRTRRGIHFKHSSSGVGEEKVDSCVNAT